VIESIFFIVVAIVLIRAGRDLRRLVDEPKPTRRQRVVDFRIGRN
jgi:hypothetical protein